MNDRLSEVSNMPTKEQKPLLGTKGARQGPQTLTDLSTSLLIGVHIQRNVVLDTDIRSEVTTGIRWVYQYGCFPMLCGYTPYWKEERESREFLKGEDYKGKATAV